LIRSALFQKKTALVFRSMTYIKMINRLLFTTAINHCSNIKKFHNKINYWIKTNEYLITLIRKLNGTIFSIPTL